MKIRQFGLWVVIPLLIAIFAPVFTFAVIGAEGAEETKAWLGDSEQLQLACLDSYEYLSASSVEWNKTYGGDNKDMAYSVRQTSDGGYIVSGSTTSFGAGGAWLIKIDAYGNVEWNKTYGGACYNWAESVQQTNDDGYIVAGGIDTGLYIDWFLAKTDTYGTVEWNKTYGGGSWDRAHSVQQTNDNGYIVAGYTASFGAGSADYWLIKTDAYGNAEWNKTYGGAEWDVAYSVQQTSEGGYIMVGSANSFKTGIFDGEIWLVKTDAYGYVEWSLISGWPDWDFAHSVQQTSDGGYIVAGTRFSSYETRYDFWLIKVDANGIPEWNKVYARPGKCEDVAYSVQQTKDGGYIVAGGWGDFWLVKTDTYGNMEWNKTYGGPGWDDAYSVQQTSDGGYIVAGYTESFGFGRDGYPDAWVVKFVPVHDVAIGGIEPSKTVVGQGYSLSIKVTVKNPGMATESFNVTAYVDGAAIGTQTVYDLSPAAPKTLTFPWNTTGYAKGNHTLSAYAWPVLNETETADNNLIEGTVTITIPGDVDGDFDIDIYDVVKICAAYESEPPGPPYNPNYDINSDIKIDIYDVVIACSHYDEKDP